MCFKIIFALKMERVFFKISLSISLRYRAGMGGLLRWSDSYVLHTMLIPFYCGVLVYRHVTSIDTSIVSFTTIVFSIKFRKSVVLLRYDS